MTQPAEKPRRREPTPREGHRVSPVVSRLGPIARTGVVAARGSTSTMEFQPRPVPAGRGLAALRHRNFRLFWSGQIVSLVGTWMQTVAQSWLVLELSGSAFTLGVVTALQFLPILIFSMLGGVVADRLPKRPILLATQSSSMLLAFVLAGLTQSGLVQILHVFILAALLGLVNAVDMPTRQAFVVELVGARDLRNAIALNSAAFNSARLIGPAVAGLAIGWVGIAGCFFINGLSFLAAIASLVFVSAGERPVLRPVEGGSVWEDLREGLVFVARTPALRLIVLLIAVVGTFGMNLSVLVPVFARDVLNLGAEGYGFLSSFMGLGSLAAALLLAFLGARPRRWLVLGAAAAFGVLQMALLVVGTFAFAAPLLAGVGFTMILFTTLGNTVLQISTPDALRGRVMSVYTTVFAGTTPIGSLFAGGIAETWSVGGAFFVGGLISVAAAAFVYLLSLRQPRRR